jgi:hypothetical protein
MNPSNLIKINGDESVEDLMNMYEENNSVITLIIIKTKNTSPATFNQFIKKLKYDKPELYSRGNKIFNELLNDNKLSINRLFRFIKNPKNKAIDKLIDNNLKIMADLLKNKNLYNNDYSDDKKNYESSMLNKLYNLQKGPANETLNRFKWSKDICEEFNFTEGSRLMQYYIEIYEIYIKKYC